MKDEKRPATGRHRPLADEFKAEAVRMAQNDTDRKIQSDLTLASFQHAPIPKMADGSR